MIEVRFGHNSWLAVWGESPKKQFPLRMFNRRIGLWRWGTREQQEELWIPRMARKPDLLAIVLVRFNNPQARDNG